MQEGFWGLLLGVPPSPTPAPSGTSCPRISLSYYGSIVSSLSPVFFICNFSVRVSDRREPTDSLSFSSGMIYRDRKISTNDSKYCERKAALSGTVAVKWGRCEMSAMIKCIISSRRI